MGYTKNTIKGISWMSGTRFVSRTLAFLKVAVLARVLSPTQFGLFGIASLLLSLLETLTETGINIVLIQSKTDINEYINAAWVVSILRGIIIALLIIVLSPLIALFFRAPDAIGIILFISLVPLVRGFVNPSEVKFQKELNFHLQFWFQSGLFIVDALVSVIVVLITHSVYSLAWGMLSSAMIEVILSLAFINPKPRFAIDRGYFKEIFHKGIWVTSSTIFDYFAENLDNVVVGRLLGAASLGSYQMAYKISILPLTEISEVIAPVIFPVYTKISDEKKRLSKAHYKASLITILSAFSLGLVIFLFPNLIIHILLGDKWLSIAPVLQVLAIYGALRTVAGPASALFYSVGKQNYLSMTIFIRFLGLVVTIYPLVHFFGLIGAGYSQVFSVCLEIPVVLYFTNLVFRDKKS
jgi:O-antigen/teichoic acid export membrane protein